MERRSNSSRIVRFGSFELDPATGELRKGGVRVKLQEQPFRLLAALLEQPGELVTREELHAKLWPGDTYVDFDQNLNAVVKKVRRALGDSSETPRFIETLPKRGYRFISPLSGIDVGLPGGPSLPELKTDRRTGWPTDRLPLRTRRAVVWAVTLVVLGVVLMAAEIWSRRAARQPVGTLLKPVPLTSFIGREFHPTFSPDSNQVAFVWDGPQEDNLDVWVKPVGPGDAIRLTRDPSMDLSPAWSPDGRFVAFARALPNGGVGIMLIPPLGGRVRQLLEVRGPISSGFKYVAWSPDSKWLVVLDGEPWGLFLLSPETLQARQLTFPPKGSLGDLSAAFSPDGRALVFSRFLEGTTADIYLQRLSEGLEPEGQPERITYQRGITHCPTWIPGGQEILFVSGYYPDLGLSIANVSRSAAPERIIRVSGHALVPVAPAVSADGNRLAYALGKIEQNIWRVAAAHTTQEPKTASRFIASSQIDAMPDFSPDGQRIAFVSWRSGSSELWVCDADGSRAQRLTSFAGPSVLRPRWSPDSRWIAFAFTVGDQAEVFRIRAEGGKAERLTQHPSHDVAPSWSRDGQWLYFGSSRSGDFQVWKMPAGGGEPARVTDNGGYAAVESLDGTTLYFSKSGDGMSSLWKVPVEGGEEVPVLSRIESQNFDITGDGVYFITPKGVGSTFAMQFYSFATHAIRQICVTDKLVGADLAASPDGRWVLYSQVDPQGSDLMLLENFR